MSINVHELAAREAKADRIARLYVSQVEGDSKDRAQVARLLDICAHGIESGNPTEMLGEPASMKTASMVAERLRAAAKVRRQPEPVDPFEGLDA